MRMMLVVVVEPSLQGREDGLAVYGGPLSLRPLEGTRRLRRAGSEARLDALGHEVPDVFADEVGGLAHPPERRLPGFLGSKARTGSAAASTVLDMCWAHA